MSEKHTDADAAGTQGTTDGVFTDPEATSAGSGRREPRTRKRRIVAIVVAALALVAVVAGAWVITHPNVAAADSEAADGGARAAQAVGGEPGDASSNAAGVNPEAVQEAESEALGAEDAADPHACCKSSSSDADATAA